MPSFSSVVVSMVAARVLLMTVLVDNLLGMNYLHYFVSTLFSHKSRQLGMLKQLSHRQHPTTASRRVTAVPTWANRGSPRQRSAVDLVMQPSSGRAFISRPRSYRDMPLAAKSDRYRSVTLHGRRPFIDSDHGGGICRSWQTSSYRRRLSLRNHLLQCGLVAATRLYQYTDLAPSDVVQLTLL